MEGIIGGMINNKINRNERRGCNSYSGERKKEIRPREHGVNRP